MKQKIKLKYVDSKNAMLAIVSPFDMLSMTSLE